ncbi:MAG TPA: hypothetical protein VK508_03785 [Cyclobacteriaceae bacterium]|nr:hypothetical protein [Cyclobacteriaceae bacterium]
MTTSFRFIVVAALLLADATVALSQSFYAIRRERSVIGYVGVGSANYFGELTNPKSLGTVKYGLNVGLEHFFTNRISGRAEVNWFQISGSDANANDSRIVRKLSFISNNIEGNIVGTINLLPNGRRFYQRQVINFYAFAGIGLLYINPKTEYNGEMVALQPLKTEGIKYSKVQPVIPFGGGIKVKAGPFFNLTFEGGIRKTFTDYIDDISVREYPDPATLSSDLSRALSNRSGGEALVRGNPEKDDWYFMMNARIQYYLPYDLSAFRRNKLYTQKRRNYRRR